MAFQCNFMILGKTTLEIIINLAVDYDMGSHLLAVRYSDYQNDIQGMIDRGFCWRFAFGYPQEVRTNVVLRPLKRGFLIRMIVS